MMPINMADTTLSLQSCPADELASWLLVNRFENDPLETASFLLQCTSTLPNAEQISAQLLGGGGNNELEEEENTEDDEIQTVVVNADSLVLKSQVLPPFITKEQSPLSVEVSCTNPRGKFLLQLFEDGIMLNNPKKPDETLIIMASNIDNVVWFRKAEIYKKLKTQSVGKKPLPGHMVLICLKDGARVIFRNKEITQVCLQLPSYSTEGSDNETEFSEGQWWKGFETALCHEEKMIRVHSKIDRSSFYRSADCFMFQSEGASGSSSTTEDMPFVGCYHGLNDGVLYPLREGLLFFKPPLFVHRSKLASICCGRGSGSASRYVDMTVQLDSKEQIEFSNIAREELGMLNDYIHKTLIPAMHLDAQEGAEGEESADEDDAVAVEIVASGDSDHSNSDDDQSQVSREKRRRPSRAASKTAREANRAHFKGGVKGSDDDDDDDDDDEEDFQSDDGSDDSGSESDATDESEMRSSDEDTDEESDDGSHDGEKEAKRPKTDDFMSELTMKGIISS